MKALLMDGVVAGGLAMLLGGCVGTQNVTALAPISNTAFSGTALTVYYFYSLNPDCTSAGVPFVEVARASGHGSVIVQKGVNHYTEYPSTSQRYKCNVNKSASVAVTYTSDATFLGTDRFSVRCIYPSGNVSKKDFVVNVEPARAVN